MSRVALANRNIGNYERSKQIFYEIPLDSISFEPTFLDVVLGRALLEKETGNWIESLKQYSLWVPEIPLDENRMLGIQYNNYGVVLQYFGLHEEYVKALELGLYHAERSDYYRTKEDVNLILKNFTNHYLDVNNFNKAAFYHNKIDTVDIDTESLATYYLSKGDIEEGQNKFIEAGISFTKSRDLANKNQHSTIERVAGKSLTRVLVKNEVYAKELRVTRILQFAFGAVAFIIIALIPGYLRSKRQNTYQKFS